MAEQELTMPAVVDDMEDTTAWNYAAFPDRLYVIAADGRVAYQSGRGPWGFLPAEMRDALADLIKATDSLPERQERR